MRPVIGIHYTHLILVFTNYLIMYCFFDQKTIDCIHTIHDDWFKNNSYRIQYNLILFFAFSKLKQNVI